MASPDYLSLPPELFLANDSLEAALLGQGNYGRAFQGRAARRAAIPQVSQSVDTANQLMRESHKLEQDNDIYKARLDTMVGLRDVLAQPGTLGLASVASNPETLPTNLVELFNQPMQDTLEGAFVQNAQRQAAGSGGGEDEDSPLAGISIQVEGQGGQTIEYNMQDYLDAGGDPAGILDPRMRSIAEDYLNNQQSSINPAIGQQQGLNPTASTDIQVDPIMAGMRDEFVRMGLIRVRDDGTLERVGGE